jgi:DNA replication protein DnaC
MAARKAWKASATPEQLDEIERLLVEEHDLSEEMLANSQTRRSDAGLARELRAAGAGPRTLEFATNPAPFPAWCAVRDWWDCVPRPTWLVLVGPRGRGKTVGAVWAAREAIALGKSARILHASALEGLSSYGDGRREFEDLARTWLLVLSDYQVSPTDRAKTQLFRLLDLRHEHKRSPSSPATSPGLISRAGSKDRSPAAFAATA